MFVPKLETNLVPVKKLAAKGAVIRFDMCGCRIGKDQKVIAAAASSRGLYSLKVSQVALTVKGILPKRCIRYTVPTYLVS